MCCNVSRALPLVEIVEKARELLLVDKMLGPMPDQVSVLKNMHVRGNPWGYPPHERTNWADGLHLTFASKENRVDVLYFVGCACSYDPRGQKIARDLSTILEKAGVHFGILEKETCSGHEARRMGETGLFQVLSEANMAMFKEAGIRHIVTADPHDFYSFSQEYPEHEDRTWEDTVKCLRNREGSFSVSLVSTSWKWKILEPTATAVVWVGVGCGWNPPAHWFHRNP
jgi:Fe-S oxidoreductase